MLRTLTATLFATVALSHADPSTLQSPGKIHSIKLSLDKDGSLHAKVMRGDKVIVKNISFGISIVGADPLTDGFKVDNIRTRELDEAYPVVLGKSATARNHCNELIVELVEAQGSRRKLEVHFRAYDDGIAFRYGFPKQAKLETFVIDEELSRFEFPSDDSVWVSQWNYPNNSNETEFKRTTIGGIKSKRWLQCPVTLERPDGITLSLYEAALTDYAGMYFRKVDGAAPTLQTRLVPLLGKGRKGAAEIRTPHPSPWRVVQSGANPADLIASNLILHLNEPSRIPDTSWIQAGKMTFPWWPNFDTGVEGVPQGNHFETGKTFIDFAASHDIRYHVVEPRWYETKEGVKDGDHSPANSDPLKPYPEMRIRELIRHADDKGVGVFLWIHWSLLAANPDEIMKTYKSWGAVGMKVDFFNRCDQDMVRIYHLLAEKAAEHRLMVFYHGAYTPTGIRRTWPNLVTREAVMGNEFNKWSNRMTLTHTLTIPFTRMTTGPMDFTPGGFRNVMPEDFKTDNTRPMVIGTRSRELAKFVIYESPIQMTCDAPIAYIDQPGTDFLRLVPSIWDESRGLQGVIGESCVVARRSGANWFIGAMTDDMPRRFEIPLDFLEPGKAYQLTQWTDLKDGKPTELVKTTATVSGGGNQKITLETARGGGAVVMLVPGS